MSSEAQSKTGRPMAATKAMGHAAAASHIGSRKDILALNTSGVIQSVGYALDWSG